MNPLKNSPSKPALNPCITWKLKRYQGLAWGAVFRLTKNPEEHSLDSEKPSLANCFRERRVRQQRLA